MAGTKTTVSKNRKKQGGRERMSWARFGLHLAAMLLLGALLLMLTLWGIQLYTHHGREVTVPDVKGIPTASAMSKLADIGLRGEVDDSVYLPSIPAVTPSHHPKSRRFILIRRLMLRHSRKAVNKAHITVMLIGTVMSETIFATMESAIYAAKGNILTMSHSLILRRILHTADSGILSPPCHIIVTPHFFSIIIAYFAHTVNKKARHSRTLSFLFKNYRVEEETALEECSAVCVKHHRIDGDTLFFPP